MICFSIPYYFEKNNESYKSIRLEEWDFIYESLFGGFEDIGEYDSEDEENEEEFDDDVEFTKSICTRRVCS